MTDFSMGNFTYKFEFKLFKYNCYYNQNFILLNSKIVYLRNILYISIYPSINEILIKNLFLINQSISIEIFISYLNLKENCILNVSLFYICLKLQGFLRIKYSKTLEIIYSGTPITVKQDSETY